MAVIGIAYSGPITLVITFITSTTAITIITAYTVAFNFRNTGINIIAVFVSIVISASVAFVEAILNTIVDNSFIDYTRELYVDDNYGV